MCNARIIERFILAFLTDEFDVGMVEVMDAAGGLQIGDEIYTPPREGLGVPEGPAEADELAASTASPMATSSSLALQVIQVCNDKQDAALVQKLLLCPAAVKALRASISSRNASPKALSLCGRKSLMLQVLSRLLSLPSDRILPAFDQPGLYALHVSDDLLVVVLWHEGADCMDFKTATNCSLVRYVTELAVDVVVCLEEGAVDRLLVTTSARPAKVKRVHHMQLVVEQVTKDDVAVHDWSTIPIPVSCAHRCMLAAGGSPKAGMALGRVLPPSRKWVSCDRGCDSADAPQLLSQLQAEYKVDLSDLAASSVELFLRLAAPHLWARVAELEESYRKDLAAVSGPVDMSAAVEEMRVCLAKAAVTVMSELAAAQAGNDAAEGGGGGQQVLAVPGYCWDLKELERKLVSVYLGREADPKVGAACPELEAPAAGAGVSPAAAPATHAVAATASAAAGASSVEGAAAPAESGDASVAAGSPTATMLPIETPAADRTPRLVYYGESLHCRKAGKGGCPSWLQIYTGSMFDFFKKNLRLVECNRSTGIPLSFLILPERNNKERACMPVCFGDRVTLKFASESINARLVSSDDHSAIGLVTAGEAVTLLDVQAEEYNSLRCLMLQHCAGDGARERTGLRACIAAVAKRQGCLGKAPPEEWRLVAKKLALELISSFGTRSLFEMKRAVASVEQKRTRNALVREYDRRRGELLRLLVEEVRTDSTGTREAAIKWCSHQSATDKFKVRETIYREPDEVFR